MARRTISGPPLAVLLLLSACVGAPLEPEKAEPAPTAGDPVPAVPGGPVGAQPLDDPEPSGPQPVEEERPQAVLEPTPAEPEVLPAAELVPAITPGVSGAGALIAAADAPRVVETVDGLAMGYEVSGEGRPLVLIHGWCGNGDQWAEPAAALARSFRVFVVDLVGHGSSASQARTDWTIAAFGDDVARLLEREGLQGAVLVGHSMGGPVALEAAVRAPGRVAAIIGVESLHRLAVDADPARMAPFVTRFKDNFPAAMGEFTEALVGAQAPPEVKARIAAESSGCDPAMAIALMEHFGTYDPKPASRIVDSPVRCINADVNPTDADGNRALLSSFEVELIGDTGHWPHLEAPDRFQAAMGRALAQLVPGPDPGAEAFLLTLGPVVRCEDVSATADFYVERLRFEAVDCTPEEDLGARGAVTLVRDGATIVLQSLSGLREDLPEVALRPGPAILRLEVSNLSEELAALGEVLRVVVPERRLASGARQVVIEDPAGSLVILYQARESL